MQLLAWYALLAVVSTALVWRGSDVLENAANRLAIYYGLPAIVQGAVLAAVGSSTPELLTAVMAPLLHGEFELGLAAIIGSAIFNILVIPALAVLATPGGLNASRDIVYKEAQFYLIAVAVFLLTLSFAVIYFPTGTNGFGGVITPLLALIPLATYGLYVFIQYQDTIEYDAPTVSMRIDPVRQWGLLLGSFVLIFIGVEGLIRAAIGFGEFFGTPSFVWGLTVIAAATSLPDAFVSVRASQRDRDVTSIANVFGSNVFDLLVAVPAGVLVAGGAAIDFSRAAPLLGFLIFATVALFTLLRTDLELSRWEAHTLLGIYVVFLVWMVLETAGYLGFVP